MSDEPIMNTPETEVLPQTQPEMVEIAPQKPAKKNLPLAVRILLAFVSVLLCICLTVTLLAGALALDLNALLHADSLTQIVDEVLYTPQPSHVRLSEESADPQSLITHLIHDAIQKQIDEGKEVDITHEEIDAFIAQASISEYLSDKTVSYLQDFIHGTENTTITTEEIESLINENKELIEETFHVTVDEELCDKITTYVEENDIDTLVHDEIFEEARNLPIAGDQFNLGHLMEIVSAASSYMVIVILGVFTLLLLVALFFTNRMRFGNTLLCAGIPALIVGLILGLPVLALQSVMPSLLASLHGAVLEIVKVVFSTIAPIHFAFLVAGALVLTSGIVIKCVTRPKLAKA